MKKNKGLILVLLIFIVLEFTMTYPLFLKATSCMPGFFSTDESYVTIWNFWRVQYSWNNHMSLRHTPLIAYPFGWGFCPGGGFRDPSGRFF